MSSSFGAASPLPHLCTHFSCAATYPALSRLLRAGVSFWGVFGVGVGENVVRRGDWRPVRGSEISETSGVAPFKTFACVAEMKSPVVVSECAPAKMIFLFAFKIPLKVISCHLGLSCCLLASDFLSRLLTCSGFGVYFLMCVRARARACVCVSLKSFKKAT